MSRGRATLALWVAFALAAPTASAQTGGAARKRRQLENQLGLPKTPARKPAPAPAPPQQPAAEPPRAPEPAGAPAPGAPPAGGDKQAPAAPPLPGFAGAVHALLTSGCRNCHAVGGAAAHTRFLVRGEARADYAATSAFVDRARPRASALLTKAAGEMHGGGVVYATTSRQFRQILAWIAAGARFEAAAPSAPAAPGATAAAPTTPAAVRPKRPRAPGAAATSATKPASPAAGPPAASAAAVSVAPAAGVPAAPGGAAAPPAGAAVAPGAGAPAAAAGAAPAPGAPPTTAAAGPPSSPTAAPATAPASAAPDFATAVHPLLKGGCLPCHNRAGTAGATRLLFSGEADADSLAVRPFVDPGRPSQSALVTKGSGVMHGGGAIYGSDTAAYKTLIAWIAAGAAGTKAAAPPAATPATAAVAPEAATSPAATPPPAAPSMPETAPQVAAPAPPAPSPIPFAGHAGLGLPLGFHLNGRFDLNYERRGLGRDSDWSDGKNTLRSYHQFLFLTRPADENVPVGLSVELLNLQIWEVNYAHRFETLGASIVVRGGKLLVPFGAEPLFHQFYGGLGGFDQRVLPPVWAQEGLAEQLVVPVGPVSLSSDLFVVRGYRLKTPEAVLNLQNDFSAIDEAKVGVGHRLGVSWLRLSGWYSLYFNPLGGGRRLTMHAIDVASGRWREIPVVGRFSAGVGFLRADVSGGGAGQDYYHFASYWQGRFYAMDWLYVQYRQGLRTFNNRRGLIVDETRLEPNDGSTHTVGLVGRWRFLSAGLHYFWNFEKADELDDDFFRAVVAFEF